MYFSLSLSLHSSGDLSYRLNRINSVVTRQADPLSHCLISCLDSLHESAHTYSLFPHIPVLHHLISFPSWSSVDVSVLWKWRPLSFWYPALTGLSYRGYSYSLFFCYLFSFLLVLPKNALYIFCFQFWVCDFIHWLDQIFKSKNKSNRSNRSLVVSHLTSFSTFFFVQYVTVCASASHWRESLCLLLSVSLPDCLCWPVLSPL